MTLLIFIKAAIMQTTRKRESEVIKQQYCLYRLCFLVKIECFDNRVFL